MEQDAAAIILDRLVAGTRSRDEPPPVLGLCGSQGSGKSTVAARIRRRLAATGQQVAVLSLDDLYLGREARARLAVDVHPLFATRGVPGTHDVALGLEVLDALACRRPCRLPRFDKATDRPLSPADWPRMDRADLILFEGWCVGARPQEPVALVVPVNMLEREEDVGGIWRREVNARLAGPYQALFGRIDRLALLAAPDFSVVAGWRTEQEHALRRRLAAEGADLAQTMDDMAIGRFVQHYERLTRHILAEMPGQAALTLRLDGARRIVGQIAANH